MVELTFERMTENYKYTTLQHINCSEKYLSNSNIQR
jgi:hypothetical protein